MSMDFIEIETLVKNGRHLSKYAMTHELACWHALRSILADYRRGTVDAKSAQKERLRIHTAYDFDRTQQETSEMLCGRWRKYIDGGEQLRAKLRKATSEGLDLQTLFYLACDCIAVMTGDKTLAGLQMERLRIEATEKTHATQTSQCLLE